MPKESKSKFDSPFDFPVEEKRKKCKTYGCGHYIAYDPYFKIEFCEGCGFPESNCWCYRVWRRS